MSIDVPAGEGGTTPAPKNKMAWADKQFLQSQYPSGVSWDIDIPKKNISSLVDEAVQKFGDKPCIDFLGKKISYKEFGDMVDKAAKGLADKGITKGDRVGLYMPNTPYYPIMFFAAAKVGATVVNFSPLYTEEELAAQIDDSGTKMMITLDLKDFFDKAYSLKKKGHLESVVKCRLGDMLPFWKSWAFKLFKGKDRTDLTYLGENNNVFDFRKLKAKSGATVSTSVDSENDVAVIQYTGGTTGVPKGAMLTHFNLMANAQQIEEFFVLTNRDKDPHHGIYMEPGKEKILAVLPYFHVFGMMVGMVSALKTGSEIIMLPNPRDMKEVLKTIDKKKPTILPSVPRLLQAMTEFKGMEKYDLSSIKGVVSGGAALPPGVQKAFEKATDKNGLIKQGYGLTETSPVAASNPAAGENKPDTIGLGYPATDIRIADPNDVSKTMNIGEMGEICIRGPQVMKGYYNKPDATAETLQDGWFLTGDLGVMDEQGYVKIVDRKKRLVIINGYNVYPNQVENAISKHEDVAECVVIGIPDDRSGEAAKAFIRLKDGVIPSEENIRGFLHSHISRIEMPKTIEFVTEELPKTAVGKPDWKTLQDAERAKLKQAENPKPADTPKAPKP